MTPVKSTPVKSTGVVDIMVEFTGAALTPVKLTPVNLTTVKLTTVDLTTVKNVPDCQCAARVLEGASKVEPAGRNLVCRPKGKLTKRCHHRLPVTRVS